MKVQELIDRLADFRRDALVVFHHHDANAGKEYQFLIQSVSRNNTGDVGINWSEGADDSLLIECSITDE